MPFTFSHPAVVLPLIRAGLKLSATGLIIGSIIPDFEYFIRMRDWSRYSHTLVGLAWFDLPLAILVCFIYHLIVKNYLFDNLPLFLKERVIKFKSFQWTKYFLKNWGVVCISILVGALTHLLWDDFTHETRFFVQGQPELSTIMKVGTVNLAGYRFLQVASTVVGGIVVVFSIILLKKTPLNKPSIDYLYWELIAFIIFSIMALKFFRGLSIHQYRVVVVSFVSSLMIALILTPLILKLKQRVNNETTS